MGVLTPTQQAFGCAVVTVVKGDRPPFMLLPDKGAWRLDVAVPTELLESVQASAEVTGSRVIGGAA